LAFAQTGFRGFCNEKLAPSVRHMVFLIQKHAHAQLTASKNGVTSEHDEPTAINKTSENDVRATKSASFSYVRKPEIKVNAVATQPATKLLARRIHQDKAIHINAKHKV